MRRTALAPAQRERRIGVGAQRDELLPGVAQHERNGLAACKRLRVRVTGRCRALQPGPRIGPGHHEFVDSRGEAGQLLLLIAGVRGHEVVPARLIAGVERVLHRLPGKHAALLLVRDAEGRVEPERMEVLAQQIAAEAVQRGDARAGERRHLTGKLRLLLRRGAQGLADAQAHFARSGVGKGDHEHAVDRAALAHEPHDALHEHGGLAGARRRADDEAVAAVLYGLLLLLRPVGHVDSPCP